MSIFFLIIPGAILISNIYRYLNDPSSSEQSYDPPAPPLPNNRPQSMKEPYPVNFIERWLRSNEYAFSNDSIQETWRYAMGLRLDTALVDIRLMLDKENNDFMASANFPLIFGDLQFHRMKDYIDAFNEHNPILEIRCERNSGMIQVRAFVPGNDLEAMGEFNKADCIRMFLHNSNTILSQLVDLAYGQQMPEIAILKTIGMRKWTLN